VKSELAEEIFALIEARSQARPTPMEFEMAYQARVAMDRIKFAIKHAEQFGTQTEPMREAGLQLLDAFQRLETADRRFQKRTHAARERDPDNSDPVENHSSSHYTGPLHRRDGQHGGD
jgi:hypothetical protein